MSSFVKNSKVLSISLMTPDSIKTLLKIAFNIENTLKQQFLTWDQFLLAKAFVDFDCLPISLQNKLWIQILKGLDTNFGKILKTNFIAFFEGLSRSTG